MGPSRPWFEALQVAAVHTQADARELTGGDMGHA